MIEFALAMPIMIFLMVIIFEVTRLIHVYSVLTESCGDVARMWSRIENQESDGSDIKVVVEEVLKANNVDLSTCTIVAEEKPEDGGLTISGRDRKIVTVEYRVNPALPLQIGNWVVFDPSFTIEASSTYPDEVY